MVFRPWSVVSNRGGGPRVCRGGPTRGVVSPVLGVSGEAAIGCGVRLPLPGSRGEGSRCAVHFAQAAHMADFSDDDRAENDLPEYLVVYWCFSGHGVRWHPLGEFECHQHRVFAAPYFDAHFVLSIEYGLSGREALWPLAGGSRMRSSPGTRRGLVRRPLSGGGSFVGFTIVLSSNLRRRRGVVSF